MGFWRSDPGPAPEPTGSSGVAAWAVPTLGGRNPGHERSSAIAVVGRHNYPDVVLEVDHTTDVRRGKLKLYESWGFPELWVEVPEHRVASRPRGLVPGLTIHLLEGVSTGSRRRVWRFRAGGRRPSTRR